MDAGHTIAKVVLLGLVIYSIVLHEIAHGYAALRLGDDTALRAGRLTLNPLHHIDPFYTLLLPLLLWWSTGGQFVFGAAKPVPINPLAFRDLRRDTAITGIAGPLVNIGIMLAACLLLRLRAIAPDASYNRYVLVHLAVLNAWLAAFNLLPVPPLDGSRVLFGLLPREAAFRYASLERLGMLGAIVAIIALEYAGVLGWLGLHVLRLVRFLGGF